MRTHGDHDPQWWAYHHATEAVKYLLAGESWTEDAADNAFAAYSICIHKLMQYLDIDIEEAVERASVWADRGYMPRNTLNAAADAVVNSSWQVAAGCLEDALTQYPLAGASGYETNEDLIEALQEGEIR